VRVTHSLQKVSSLKLHEIDRQKKKKRKGSRREGNKEIEKY
jgi:hypothetical protein